MRVSFLVVAITAAVSSTGCRSFPLTAPPHARAWTPQWGSFSSEDPSSNQKPWWKDLTSAALLVVFLATPLELHLEQAAGGSIHVQPCRAHALTEEQLLVTDVWREVTRQYLDTSYNGMGEEKWKAKRLEAVKQVTNVGPDEPERVYDAIRQMLSALGDPYTRFLTPAQYQVLTDYAKGSSAGGVGVSLQVDPRGGSVVVLGVTENGPAARGGIRPGDAIVEVDGMDVTTAPAEVVAAKCRGAAGTNVNLALRRPNDRTTLSLTLERAALKVNPVQTETASVGGKTWGVIRLSSFSQETTQQVVEAVRRLQKDSIAGLVLDVRGNAGGYMPAGVDVAKLFLPPQARIITEVDKSDRRTIEIADGVGSETKLPLYVVVDGRTASASEIMTAGLQDNQRATVVGATNTFGKGRIQNVQEVGNGSGIAVTKAKYLTPNGRDIHGVGIAPNIRSDTCGPENTVSDCLTSVL